MTTSKYNSQMNKQHKKFKISDFDQILMLERCKQYLFNTYSSTRKQIRAYNSLKWYKIHEPKA